jgi:hypothetical protein
MSNIKRLGDYKEKAAAERAAEARARAKAENKYIPFPSYASIPNDDSSFSHIYVHDVIETVITMTMVQIHQWYYIRMVLV